MILLVVWVVLMVLWLAFSLYPLTDHGPRGLAGVLLPWACVLILGLVVFGAVAR